MKKYYVVYNSDQVIGGPMSRQDAESLAEDLDFALMDKGYQAVTAKALRRAQAGGGLFIQVWQYLKTKTASLKGSLVPGLATKSAAH